MLAHSFALPGNPPFFPPPASHTSARVCVIIMHEDSRLSSVGRVCACLCVCACACACFRVRVPLCAVAVDTNGDGVADTVIDKPMNPMAQQLAMQQQQQMMVQQQMMMQMQQPGMVPMQQGGAPMPGMVQMATPMPGMVPMQMQQPGMVPMQMGTPMPGMVPMGTPMPDMVPMQQGAPMVNVTVPEGKQPGDTFKAQMPDGQVVKVAVPEGAGPGAVVQVPVPQARSPADVRVCFRYRWGDASCVCVTSRDCADLCPSDSDARQSSVVTGRGTMDFWVSV
jgi:hypothetical protein